MLVIPDLENPFLRVEIHFISAKDARRGNFTVWKYLLALAEINLEAVAKRAEFDVFAKRNFLFTGSKGTA